jgi:hypothetical protein
MEPIPLSALFTSYKLHCYYGAYSMIHTADIW